MKEYFDVELIGLMVDANLQSVVLSRSPLPVSNSYQSMIHDQG